MSAQLDLKTIWEKVSEQVKLNVINTTLWRALELAVPVTVENGQFVVGFRPGEMHMSGHLLTSDHKNAIENAIRTFIGESLSFRIIEGTTLQDWQHTKAKDEHAAAMRDAAFLRRQKETEATRSWEGLLETVGRRYANMPLRQFPQMRARYIQEIVAIISDTMDELMPRGKPADELAERGLARALDKAGTLTEVPPALIALELRRYRGE